MSQDKSPNANNSRVGLSSNAVIRENAQAVTRAQLTLKMAERRIEEAYNQVYPVPDWADLTRQAELAAAQYRRALITFIGKP